MFITNKKEKENYSCDNWSHIINHVFYPGLLDDIIPALIQIDHLFLEVTGW